MLFSFRCACGQEEDRFCSRDEISSQSCECGKPMTKLITGGKLTGPTDTKPADVGGKTFTKASDIARWENSEESRGLRVVSKTDREVVDTIYRKKHEKEVRAQSRGYKSEKARQQEVIKEARMTGQKIGG